MSKGPGILESRIADLFAATRDRALSIDEITDNAYALGGRKPTRAQRLSATRAAHRVLRRVRELHERADKLRTEAKANTEAALGRRRTLKDLHDQEFLDRFWSDPAFFHPPDVPLEVWAVSIQPAGVIWADTEEITRVTERFVMVRYAGAIARLNRWGLWLCWAWWRGVMFVSSRTGRIADMLDAIWQKRYGARNGGPAATRMPLATAMQLLGVPENYTKADVLAAFRKAVKKAHPDVGGTEEMFRLLVEARDRLLAAIGTSAPAPKPSTYTPKGVRVVYRTGRSSRQRIGSTRYLTG